MNKFNLEDIKSAISSKIIGKEVIFFDEIDSTNSFLKENCEAYTEGYIVVACSQKNGRGRRGNNWENSANNSIFMSILLKPSHNFNFMSTITLMSGLAVVKAINSNNAKIKWPNDIILNEKKVGGILAELVEDSFGEKNLILGIGINVHTKKFSDEIKDKATSLNLENIDVSIPNLIGDICMEFEKNYFKFIEDGFGVLIDEYKKNCITIGKEVKIINGAKEEIGFVVDINGDGTLLFEDTNGNVKNIFAGEVSVRGINGYL